MSIVYVVLLPMKCCEPSVDTMMMSCYFLIENNVFFRFLSQHILANPLNEHSSFSSLEYFQLRVGRSYCDEQVLASSLESVVDL